MKPPIQCFNPSAAPEDVMPKRDVELHRFSPHRKSTLIAISMLMTIALIIAGAVTTASQYGKVGRRIEASGILASSSTSLIRDNLKDSRNLSLALAVGSLLPVMLVVAILLRQGKNEELEDILEQLHRTQNQVISRQKLVELGELAAGVAHEIRNPLNFIQNFSQTSEHLMKELKETLDEASGGAISDDQQGLIDEIATDLKENMTRMREHSGRANRIVEEMLAMGSNTSGAFRETNINQLVRGQHRAGLPGRPGQRYRVQPGDHRGAGPRRGTDQLRAGGPGTRLSQHCQQRLLRHQRKGRTDAE